MSKKISELPAATTPISGSELVEISQGGVSKSVAASYLSGSVVVGRELLTAARTYYVRTDGSDSNTGLVNSSGGAFLTIQKGIDVAAALDNGGYDITIRVVAGTYTGACTLKTFVGNGRIIIRGDTADLTSSIVSTTSDNSFYAVGNYGVYHLEYMKIQTTTSGNCLFVGAGSYVTFSNINFGTTAGNHVVSSTGGQAEATGSYTISGGAQIHIGSFGPGANIVISNRAVTLSGTPAFSSAFAQAGQGAGIYASSATFSGAATGKRYDLSMNAIMYTGSGGANFFPGNSAGTTLSGGQYA